MKELMTALVAARASIGHTVHKAARNQHGGYNYVGHEQVVAACRGAMTANGLVGIVTDVSFIDELKTAKGTPVWRWRGTCMVAHVSGESMICSVEATTMATDKAAYVASTSVDRTFLLRLMGLAGSEEEDPGHGDPEHNSHDAASFPTAKSILADMGRVKPEAIEPKALPSIMEAFAEEIMSLRVADKQPIWHAFGELCDRAKLVPGDVVAAAKASAGKARAGGRR